MPKSKTPKILRVANIVEEARWGGPQKRVADIAHELQEQNIETTVILPKLNSEIFLNKMEEKGVNSILLSLTRLSPSLSQILRFLLYFPSDILRIRQSLKDVRADLVHCNSSTQWKGLIAAKTLRLPVLWHLNDTYISPLIRFVFILLSPFSSGFIVASNRTEALYLGRHLRNKPRFQINSPVDCHYFDSSKIKAEKSISDHKKINVGLVGNVNPDKDIKTYVCAAQLLYESEVTNISFFQVGGQYESQRQLIDKVNTLNKCPDGTPLVQLLGLKQDVRPFLKSIDIYVCSSRAEASPMSVWEAMAMGLPIISTDVGDIATMNDKGDFARIVNTGDYQALSQAILELSKNPEEASRLGRNARIYALKHLDVSSCTDLHAKAYRAMINHDKHI